MMYVIENIKKAKKAPLILTTVITLLYVTMCLFYIILSATYPIFNGNVSARVAISLYLLIIAPSILLITTFSFLQLYVHWLFFDFEKMYFYEETVFTKFTYKMLSKTGRENVPRLLYKFYYMPMIVAVGSSILCFIFFLVFTIFFKFEIEDSSVFVAVGLIGIMGSFIFSLFNKKIIPKHQFYDELESMVRN